MENQDLAPQLVSVRSVLYRGYQATVGYSLIKNPMYSNPYRSYCWTFAEGGFSAQFPSADEAEADFKKTIDEDNK